jgi:hypothetical protein
MSTKYYIIVVEPFSNDATPAQRCRVLTNRAHAEDCIEAKIHERYYLANGYVLVSRWYGTMNLVDRLATTYIEAAISVIVDDMVLEVSRPIDGAKLETGICTVRRGLLLGQEHK